ncbi:ComEA family DNA-binding protein [Paenibacillus jamilae]|uniref:ComEA family DNA-binding protein n=1 Tax=Paenibacillus jamilae TaxID=114136 RepID=UPI003D2E6F07
MKRVWTGTAITLAVIGSGLILFAGGQRSEPQEEWSLLNHKAEQSLAIKSEPIESQRNSERDRGIQAVKEISDQAERNTNVGAVDNVKLDAKQNPTGVSTAGSESSMAGDSSTVKQSDVVDSKPDTAVASSNVATTSRTNTGSSDSVIPSVSGEKKININTANAAELMELPGVGAKKAEAILNYRNQHGLFKRVNDLDHVKGIGAKMLAKMKPYVSL